MKHWRYFQTLKTKDAIKLKPEHAKSTLDTPIKYFLIANTIALILTFINIYVTERIHSNELEKRKIMQEFLSRRESSRAFKSVQVKSSAPNQPDKPLWLYCPKLDKPCMILKPLPITKFERSCAFLTGKAWKSCVKQYAEIKAKEAKLDPKLILSIIKVETNWRMPAKPSKTNDYGLLQLNFNTLVAKKYKPYRAASDPIYSINIAIELLKEYKKQFAALEPDTWQCRYNIGYQNLPDACANYLNKLKNAQN